MYKKLMYGRTHSMAKRFIAIILCIGMLLSMSTSLPIASADEVDDDTDLAEIGMETTDDMISDGFIELEPTEDDPLLDETELSAAAIALLGNEFSQLDEEPVNEPPEQEPVTLDGTTIEKITVRWLSTSTGADSPAGFGRLKLAPDSNKVTNQQFQIDFSLSGQSAYEPGDIEIIFPAYLWLDRDGEEPGGLTLSVPEEPETGVDFVWKRVGDNIVITNAKRLPAASKVLIQGTFRDVSAWKMEDETLSNAFDVTLIVTTSEGNELSMTSNSIDAHIDTSVKVTGASKTAYDSNSKKYNLYWEEVPSALPKDFLTLLGDKDPEEYVYIRWYITGTASGSQPFEMTVTDTIEKDEDGSAKYGGIMLGATNTAEGNVKADGETVTAKIFDGYTENYKTAYIWTAYPKDQFVEGEDVTFHNTQTITVTGWDDHEPSEKSASADVKTWSPIHYKFIKFWNDNDNENGVRPEDILLNIYDGQSSSTPSEQVTLTQEDAKEDDESRWVYEWTDEGQPGHDYWVEEELRDYWGVYEDRFDNEDIRHQLKWNYYLDRISYDPGTHTWEYVNTYDDGWVEYEISEMEKEVEEKYQNNKIDATTDSALNDLLRGKSTEIQFPVWASLSAAKAAVGYGAKPNTFVLEDGTYSLNNKGYSDADMNIGAVILETPIVWRYSDDFDEYGRYDRIALTGQTVTLYGYINENWISLAEITTEGVITPTHADVTVTGQRVNLPDNTAKVKTEIKSEVAAIVEMEYTVCLRLNPTPTMMAMVQGYIDTQDYVVFPVFNQANGYVVYNGDQAVDVDGRVYQPGEKIADLSDFAIGYVHGRQRKVAAELTKSFKVTDNDIINQSVIIHTELTLTQQSNLTVWSEYQTAIEEGEIPNTISGTYYDLLPEDVSPDLKTLMATNGDTIAGYYIIEDYQGSGRTLLVVKVNFVDNITYTTKNTHENYETYPAKGYKNSHTIEFDSLVTWEVIQERGLDYMRNVAAYEADEEWIGSVTGWKGEPDDPTKGNNITSANAVKDAAGYMTGLDHDREDPSFVYAGSALEHEEIDVVATTSLWKYVQVNGTGLWSNGQRNNINVEEGGNYVYQLTMKSAEDTTTRDIIIIDSLENYIPTEDDKADYGDEQWRGSLVSIDVSDLVAAGIKPVIYYSTVPELDVSGEKMGGGKSSEDDFNVLWHLKNDRDSDGNLVWSTTAPADLADVTAIAIDARKTVEDEEFVLNPEESLTVYLHMKAPFEENNPSPEYFKDTDGTDYLQNAHAYNAVYLDCLQTVEGQNTRGYIHYEYTKVGIYTKYIHVSKVWDDGNDADGYRPESLTVRLLANGKDTGKYLVLSEENNWSDTFERVHTYDDDGNWILYTFSEDGFEDEGQYKFTFSQTLESDGHIEVVLTNRHTPEQTEISVTKTWAGDSAATRPDSVVIRLYADGVFTGRTLTLRADSAGNWFGTFTGLNKNRDGGTPIVYTIEEEYVDNYLSEVEGFTVTNTYHPQGNLIVHKDVKNITGVSADTKFTFELLLVYEDGSPVADRYAYVIYDELGEVVESGEIGDGDDFTLIGGQYIVIWDIPTHVRYTVEENSASGFTLTSVSGDTGMIKSGDNEAYFTNTYSSSGSFQLDVTKKLTGRELMRHQFRFDLTDAEGNVIYSAYNDLEGKVSFTQIKYTEADHDKTFTYYVHEYNSGQSGYQYDDAEYKIVVYVHDNGSGSMICDVTHYNADGEEIGSIVFENEYHASATLTFRLWKTIDRDIDPGEFTFVLFDQNFNPLSTATNDAAGAVLFEELSFDENDIGKTYLYFAREQKGEDETVRYSDTILGYAVMVTDNGDGTLSFDSQAYDLSEFFDLCTECGGSGECDTCHGFGYLLNADEIELDQAATPVIHNGLADGSLSVTKHVSSATGEIPDEEFRFKVVLIGDNVEDGEFTYRVLQIEAVEFANPEELENTGNVIINFFRDVWAWIQNAVNTADTHSAGAGIALTAVGQEEELTGEWKDGEFSFVLHGGQQAVFSDIPAGTAYQVWEETANGWMLVSQSNTSGMIEPKAESQAEFWNQYQPAVATAVLMGVKYFDGKATNVDNNGNRFEFVLLGEDGKAIEYVDAQPGGFITFSTLKFEDEGTYHYKIREVPGKDENIQYDGHEEEVTIVVAYDDNGNLVAKVEYDDDGVVFKNKTMPGSLEITKITEGLTEANKDVTFTFRVKFYNPSGVPVTDGAFTWYVKNTETGEIIDMQDADLAAIIGSMDSGNVISGYNQDIMPIAGEHGELLDSSSTGTVGTVRWTVYADGTLAFEPTEGDEGELTMGGSWSAPWYSFASQVKTIESTGMIHVIGDVPYLFAYMSNLEDASALADWDMSQATSFNSLFYNYNGSKLTDLSFMSNWDMSNVTNMSYMVGGTAITDVELFRDWDFSKVTSINGMFYNCSKLTDISALSEWDFGVITDIGSLFGNCTSLEDISPIANWDVSNIRYMNSLFSGTNLTDVSPIANWDVSNVAGMYGIFANCKSLKDVNALSGWNTSNLSNAGGLFQNSGIEDLSGIASWDMSSVTDMGYMFNGCTALTNVDALLKWNVSNVLSMRYMFNGCTALSDVSGLSRWRVVSVSGAEYSGMEYMFANCTSLSGVDGLSGWTFGDAPVNMQYMFQNAGIVNVNGLLGWNDAKVGIIIGMFKGCSKLTDITGLVNLDVSNCTSLVETFYGCSALKSLTGLENWDVSKVTSMNNTFRTSGVSDLTALKKWDVSKVTYYAYAFYGCSGLKTLEGLEDWTIKNGANSMFEGSGVVDASAIGSWTLLSGGSFGWLFANSGSLTTLDFSDWDGSKISNVDNMWTSGNVSKITFGQNFWNGSTTSKLTVNPKEPPKTTTTGYWIREEDEFDSNPTTYTSAELVAQKVVGTFIWQYLPPYEITFDEDGGSGSMANVKNYYHLECELPENAFTKPGYIFVGWRDQNGKAYYYDNAPIVIPKNTYQSGEQITLTAIWEPVDSDGRVEYTIEYYQQSATNPEQYVLVETVVKKAEPGDKVYLEKVEYPGFVTPDDAEGWYEIPTNGYLNVQLYYDRVHYTIHFDSNGAEYGSMSDIDMVGDVAVTLPELGFGITSGAFLGWNTDKDGEGDWYYPGQTVKNLANDSETITLYAQWRMIDQSVEATAGEIIVTCGPGQTIVIQGLPAGITYEIEEIDMPAGWHYSSGTNQSGTIQSNNTAYSFVTNEYLAKGQATINAHKKLDGASLSSGQFGFTLSERVDESYNIIDTVYNGTVDTIEQTTDDDGNVVDNPYYGTAPVIFDAIEYTEPGEYVYYITEIDGGNSSVNYDSHTETVRVIVTDNGDGTLNTEVIYENGVEPVFTNSMKPGDLVVSKELSNGTNATNDVEFSFRLLLQDSDGVDLTGEYTAKKSDGTTLNVTNGDVVTIKAGEQFTVYELPHGCRYQVVELSRDGFTLAWAQGDTGEIIGGETSYAVFSNVYSAHNELVLRVTKQFIGGTISAEQFAFELVDQNNEHIETVYADENGNVVFSPIDFTESDVGSHFVYHIFEISMDDDHIIYDTHTADIAVTVVDNADGTIGFEMDYDEADLVFKNVALFDLDVRKTVAGNMGNKNETFTFSMVLSNAEYDLDDYVQYQKGEESGTIRLSDDHYEFTLMHDESIMFIGLPVGTEYVIVETGAERYGTSISVTASADYLQVDGKQVSDTLNANTAVSYVNTIESRVPTDATTVYGWVIAVMMMSLAVFIVIAKRKRAKK